MPLRIRRATTADRPALHALLAAQMVEHQLPAEPDRIDRGLDAAFRAGSPAWLLTAEGDGAPAGASLATRIFSVEKGGDPLWFEERYATPEARRTGVARALLAH